MVALLLRAARAGASLFERGFDPARARRLPIRNAMGESNVRGMFLVGEIAGTPLIKLGLNRGRAVVDHIAERDRGGDEPGDSGDERLLDVIIVGAGSSGLGAADRCQELGLRYLVIEQERTAQLIRNFTRGKPLFMEPPDEENQTRLFCDECAKEELLEQDTHGVVTAGLFRGYQVIADIWLVGIIPVALYPIYGGKIWCRYWCPLAKWMQMTSKWFGSLQISSNEKCITCGECSRYCEVGIDVMRFAKSQQSFHNGNSSCIHCGICITVCPMDVLSFDNDHRGTLRRGRRVGVALTVNGGPAGDG